MQPRGPAHAREPSPDAVRRGTLLLALLVAALAAGLATLRSRALPPVVVWTLRAADAPGHESLTVHSAPGGAALAGRWILAEDASVSREPGGGDAAAPVRRPRVPSVVLVRLPLDGRDDAGALTLALGGGEILYRPWADGRTATDMPGTVWHAWRRSGL